MMSIADDFKSLMIHDAPFRIAHLVELTAVLQTRQILRPIGEWSEELCIPFAKLHNRAVIGA